MSICAVEDCSRVAESRGWCSMHYERWRLGKGPRRIKKPCSVDGCDRMTKGRGLCETHYARWRRGSKPRPPIKPRAPKKPCVVDPCERPVAARGMCLMHYQRWSKYGDPGEAEARAQGQSVGHFEPSFVDKVWARVQVQEGRCWIWTGPKDRKGYGSISHKGRIIGAHRATWELCVGPIPEGHQIDHLCRNTSCVNPEHLEPVTRSENVLRGNKTGPRAGPQCPHGHEMTEDNTSYDFSIAPRGIRRCRTCRREHARKNNKRRALSKGRAA